MRGSHLLLFLVLASSAAAEVLFSDHFDYADGSLTAATNTAWTSHSGVAGQAQVVFGRLLLRGNDSEDVNAELDGQPYTSDTNTMLYVGMTIRFSSLPAASGQYFCHLMQHASAFRSKVFAITDGAASGKYRLGICNATGSPAVTLASDLLLHTDYRLVFRYAVSNAVATLWIDPSVESDSSLSAGDAASPIDVKSIALRQSSGIGELQVDDLVVGTLFGDVTADLEPQPPLILAEPQDRYVVPGATARYSVLAAGEAPLHYQWQFTGTDLVDGLAPSLVITNVSAADQGEYAVTVSNRVGTVTSRPAMLQLVPAADLLSLLNYNVKGNHVADWSTNSLQVRAIARQVRYLDPDIIAFQEIPFEHSSEMTNFVTAFLPGYYLASNSGTDGFIKSVILSRYPINHSRKWLDNASLLPFGYDGNFTRDLFEAEIAVPGFPQPVHLFTVHLKSGQDSDSCQRRAAEAGAISNFFAGSALMSNSASTYLLSGDMNQDIFRPTASDLSTVAQLVGSATGLQLTTPLNPFSGSDMTFSSQAAIYTRYDYILPCGLLYSNIVASQVFRTDLLPELPVPLLRGDSSTASDHLPVSMQFINPFSRPCTIVDVSAGSSMTSISWRSAPSLLYDIEAGATVDSLATVASNLVSVGCLMSHQLPLTNSVQFYRVRRH